VAGADALPPRPPALNRTVVAYRAAAGLTRVLPGSFAQAIGRGGALGASGVLRDQRFMIERNLKRVYGQGYSGIALRRSVQQTLDYYARYWVESFRLPGTSSEELDAGMSFEGYHRVENAVDSGVGPIIALPHLGGWEWGGFWLASTWKHRVTVVVEPLEPPELFDWFAGLRESFGMEVVPLGVGAGSAVVNAIKTANITCLLCDRDIGGNGVEVEFFGERTTLPAGPATLALRTGAALLPSAVYFRGKGHHAAIREPVPVERRGRLREDVQRITQLLAYELESLIRAEPEQWHLLQPNWPSDHEALAARRA
jgi:phosphatidylinositol dimannoside acyltransferase